MRKLFAVVLLWALPFLALAVDVETKVTVKYGNEVVVVSATNFAGLTAAEATDLDKRGMKTLDFASQHQDKGGQYTIVWEWTQDGKARPAVETSGMKLSAVNQVLRRGTGWLNSQIDVSEKAEKGGKSRPWGK